MYGRALSGCGRADEKAGVGGGSTKKKNGEGGVEDEEAADAARNGGRQRSGCVCVACQASNTVAMAV